MSLKFLSKKSWHTTNLDNVEKVWIAEQAAEKEKRKLAELQKQINEERQIQELRQLQVASGQVVKNVDTSLDWMYEGPSAQSEQSTEEYLLGKIFKPKDSSANDIKNVAQQPGSLWLNKISSRNDTFTRLHEDPMLLIRKNEKEARENIVNNPVKMARIRHQLAADIQTKKEKKEHKKEKKREEKELKKKHKEKSDRERSRSPKRDRSRSPKRGQSRSPARNHQRRSNSRDRKRQRSSSSSPEQRRRKEHKTRDRSASSEKNQRSSSPHRNDRETHHHGSERTKDTKYQSDERENQSLKGRYGLIRTTGSNHDDDKEKRRKSTGDLGPKQELLAKKKQEEEELERQRKLKLQQSRTSGYSKQLTEEEKQKRLQEMMGDAAKNDELRLHRHRPAKSATTSTTTENNLPLPADADDGPGPTAKGIAKGTFLQSLRSEVYTSETTAMGGMEDRMRRNRHYYQKGLDLESDGFMKKPS